MELADYLGDTFIVSLNEDHEKRDRLIRRLKDLGINSNLFITERLSPIGKGLLNCTPRSDKFFMSKAGEFGCMHSHYTIVKRAKMLGLPKCTIIEDDSLVIKEWRNTVKPSLDAIPDDVDFLYLNSCPRFPGTNFEFINGNKIVRAWCFSCTSAYTIYRKFYDTVIDFFESGMFVADNVYGWLQNMDPSDKSVPDWRNGPSYSSSYKIYGLNPSLIAPNVNNNSSIRSVDTEYEYDYHIRNNFTIKNYSDYE